MCPFNNDRPVRLGYPVYFLIALNVSKIFLSVCGSTCFCFLQECEWKVDCNYCEVVRDTWKQPQNIKTCLKLSVIITPRLDRFCQNKDGWDHCYYFNCELGDIPHIKYETGGSWESWKLRWHKEKMHSVCVLWVEELVIVDIEVSYTQCYCQNHCQGWWCGNA